MLSWLYKKIMRNRRREKAIPKPKRILLRLEVLEDRLAPAAFLFTGAGASANWSDPNNWLANGGKTLVAPAAADDVRLTGAIPSIQNIPNLTIQSLTLDATFTSTLTLTNALIVDGGAFGSTSAISGGTITGNDLTFLDSTPGSTSTVNWTGGTMQGTAAVGETRVAGNVILNISGNQVKKLDSRVLDDEGQIVWTGSGDIQLDHQSALKVETGGKFYANAANGNMVALDAASSFTLLATSEFISNPGANGQTTLGVKFNNNGVAEVRAGTLDLASDSTTTGNGTPGSANGTFTVFTGALLNFDSAGHATLDGATITGTGNVDVANGGYVTLVNQVYVVNLHDTSVNLDGGGTLNVSGTFTAIGQENWSGGGNVHIQAGAHLELLPTGNAGNTFNMGRTLINDGTVEWLAVGNVTLPAGVTIFNNGGDLFDFQTGGTITGGGKIINAGTFRKSQGSDDATVDVQYKETGGGNLQETDGHGHVIFTKKVALLNNVLVVPGSGIAFNGGAELDAGGSILDNGTITAVGDFAQNGGGATVTGTFTTTGNYLYNAGTFALSAGTLTANKLAVAVGVTFSGYGSVYANVVNVGEIDAVDNVDSTLSPLYVYGTYTQTAGSPTNPSVTNVNSGNTLQVSGLVDVTGGTVNVDGNGSTLVAQAGFNEEGGLVDLNIGTINVTGIYAESGGLTTLEAGTLIASGPGYGVQVTGSGLLSGYGAIIAGVNNASEVDAQGGKLAVTGGYVQTGVTNVNGVTLSVTGALDEVAGAMNMAGGALHVNGGYIIESSALLDGAGQLIADVTNNGTISCGTSTTFGGFSCINDTMYGIQGNYSQSATGVLNMKIGGVNSYDTMSATGLASLGGTFNLSLINGFVPSSGDVYYLFQGRSTGGFAVCNLPQVSNGTLMPMYNWRGMAFYVYDQPNGYY